MATVERKWVYPFIVCARCGVPICRWMKGESTTYRHNPGGRLGVTCGKLPVPKVDGQGYVTARGIRRLKPTDKVV